MEYQKIGKDAVNIRIDENLTIETVQSLDVLVERAFSESAATICIGMMSAVFVDSSGIGSIIKTLNRCREANKRMILYGVSTDILTLFRISKLDVYMEIKTPEDIRREFPDFR